MYLLYAMWLLSHIPSTCMGQTTPKHIGESLYLHNVRLVEVL